MDTYRRPPPPQNVLGALADFLRPFADEALELAEGRLAEEERFPRIRRIALNPEALRVALERYAV